jgi:hypothetical protein
MNTYYTINPTNHPPLSFNGVLLFSQSTSTNRSALAMVFGRGRYNELLIYKTDSEKYVIHCVYNTLQKNELGNSIVYVVDSPDKIFSSLQAYQELCFNSLIAEAKQSHNDSLMGAASELMTSFEKMKNNALNSIPGATVRI